jgi:hypothetical protein
MKSNNFAGEALYCIETDANPNTAHVQMAVERMK